MKIVITNESGLQEHHLDELRQLGEVVVCTDPSTPENIVERLADADVAVMDVFLTPITRELLQSIQSVSAIALNTTGYDNVDVAAVQDLGVTIMNVPNYCTNGVAELSIGLMFSVVRKMVEGDNEFREALISADPGTEAGEKYVGTDMYGKTLGVVGLGDIGTRVAEIGKGIGMQVIAYDTVEKEIEGVENVSHDDLLERSDVISVHVPQTDNTKHFFDTEGFGKMKRSAIIINTGANHSINYTALANALNDDVIAGAGLDTYFPETKDDPIFHAKNVVFTPHIGYNTKESHENMTRIIVDNIKSFVEGNPANVIR